MKTYDELLAERDALVARVVKLESLRDSGEARLELITDIVNAVLHNNVKAAPIEAVASIGDILDADRSKCLAEVKAEAGRAGYVACVKDLKYCSSQRQLSIVESYADIYAEKIRKGEQSGTWLRDENVNGGKRQGGAE